MPCRPLCLSATTLLGEIKVLKPVAIGHPPFVSSNFCASYPFFSEESQAYSSIRTHSHTIGMIILTGLM